MVTNETQEQLEARGWDFTEEFIPDEPTVNNQDKTIDVSENGTIEVTPDEGFTGLGKVTVNTNVEGGGGESSKRYYRIELRDTTDVFVQFYGTNIKTDMGDGEVAVVGVALIFAYNVPSTNWKAIAIDIDTPTYSPTGSGIISFREQIEMQGGNVDDLSDLGLISITEAEFYDLNA